MRSSTIDWEVIRRRVDIATGILSGNPEDNPEQMRQILDARARVLARPSIKPDETEQLEVLTFALAVETYGVEVSHVREVCQLKDLTTLPNMPSFLAGVTNLRGQILAIVDLRKLFDLPTGGITELNRVIVLKNAKNEFGLLADAIYGIHFIAISALQEGLPTLTGIREKFLKGVTGQGLAVLDGNHLLEDTSLKINEKVK